MVAGVVFVVCAWFEWLFKRWWGLVLWSLGMSLGSEALFRVSFWVAFCGCSFELMNSGCQCWVSTAVRLSSTNECDTRMMNMMIGHVLSGTNITVNQ
jgi:hypothetical protein